MSAVLHRFENIEAASSALADWVSARVLDKTGQIVLALPGGTTPGHFLRRLALMPLPWERMMILPGDERWVPVAHPQSNEGMIRHGLAAEPRAIAAVHPVFSKVLAPAEVADSLSRSLPFLDIVVLGMGEDGHVASLFPGGNVQVSEPGARFGWVENNPKDGFRRLTLTQDAVLQAGSVALLIGGAPKLALIEEVLSGAPIHLPVSPILARAGKTHVFAAL